MEEHLGIGIQHGFCYAQVPLIRRMNCWSIGLDSKWSFVQGLLGGSHPALIETVPLIKTAVSLFGLDCANSRLAIRHRITRTDGAFVRLDTVSLAGAADDQRSK